MTTHPPETPPPAGEPAWPPIKSGPLAARNPLVLVGVGAVALMLLGLFGVTLWQGTLAEVEARTDEERAGRICQEHILRRGEVPKDVDWQASIRVVKKTGPRSFHVAYGVESRSREGRTKWISSDCHITHKGGDPNDAGNWSVDSLVVR